MSETVDDSSGGICDACLEFHTILRNRKLELLPCPFLQVPKCFVPVQIFWARPKIRLHLVLLQKLLCQHKNQFYWMQIIFLSSTKCLWLPQYVNKFLVWYKKFGPAQNILGPVKGQGINAVKFLGWFKIFGPDKALVFPGYQWRKYDTFLSKKKASAWLTVYLLTAPSMWTPKTSQSSSKSPNANFFSTSSQKQGLTS